MPPPLAPIRRLTGFVVRIGRRCRPAPPSLPGSALAALLVAVSLTPSLLPRTWLVQGVISGISAAAGYAAGVLAAQVAVAVFRRSPGGRLRRRGWVALAVIGPPLITVAAVQGSRWQRDLHVLVGAAPPPRFVNLGVLALAAAILAVLIGTARLVRAGARLLAARLGRFLRPDVARWVTGCGAVLVMAVVAQEAVYGGLLGHVTATSEAVNRLGAAPQSAPTSPGRSGGPASLVNWRSLGQQGRAFVSDGPSLAQLRQFAGSAVEPVRVYVGLDSAATLADRAALAVREPHRTGAFTRRALIVVTTTGTGWIDPRAAAAVEYLFGGDTASVGMQYSYLPSWVSFLTEGRRVADAGRELFRQVHAAWVGYPPATRPKLLVFGESLGSLGSEAAFANLAEVTDLADAALWVGPTNTNPLWRALLGSRDPGTAQVSPMVDGGAVVRFATGVADLRPGLPRPRVAYLQHASDPVTWWSPALLLRRPDWLREPRGRGVLPAMRWYPFVTFWQVSGDLARAGDAPPGYGHSYQQETAAAWAAMLAPPGWTEADTHRLIQAVDTPRLRAVTSG